MGSWPVRVGLLASSALLVGFLAVVVVIAHRHAVAEPPVGAPAPGARGSTGAPPSWVDAWAAAMIPSTDDSTGLTDRTVRMIVHPHAGGTAVRVQLSNAFGDSAVTFGGATIGLRDTGAGIRAGTDRTLTFSGSSTVTVAAGADILSDPAGLTVRAGQDLVVSVYLPIATGRATLHPLAGQTNYLATGDHSRDLGAVGYGTTTPHWYFLESVAVSGNAVPGAIVALGDSLTDGALSTSDANRRWPDLLSARLVARYGTRARSVLNEGIAGNSVLADHPTAGPSALNRLARDVLDRPGLSDVILLEGVNDLRDSDRGATADELIAGYRQIIAQVHAKHTKIFGATLTPLGGADGYPEAAAQRATLNAWIRTSGEFDGVIDFDRATRDPGDPERLRPAYDSGDHLHLNDAGYQAMANAIDLSSFA